MIPREERSAGYVAPHGPHIVSEHIQPISGWRVTLAMGPMIPGAGFYACRYLNGRPGWTLCGYPALTIAGVVTRWALFEDRIGSARVENRRPS
jgi:hypothetical protein